MAIVITGSGSVTAPSLDTLPEVVRTRATRAERVSQLALAAADAALLDAGLHLVDGEPRAGIGVVLGTAFGCFLTNAAYQHRVATGGPAAASPRLVAAMETGVVPPTAGLTHVDPACAGLDLVHGSARATPVRISVSTSSGFAGANAALVLAAA